MSRQSGSQSRVTTAVLRDMKERGEKIAMLTCYDYSMARLMDESGVDVLLIGDSLGNTMLGYENTLPVTMDDMIHHTAAVSRGTGRAFVLSDMPFLSYQTSVRDAVYNAGCLLKEGHAHGVKLEGGERMLGQIRAIAAADIPVCAHLGLTPQSVHAFGGNKVQGKNAEDARRIVDDALAVEEAGAFMLVLECVPDKLARIVTERVGIPTIGIGAGVGCDGQVLVCHDMLGMNRDFKPKFVKCFADAGDMMCAAFRDYISEVKSDRYPADEHSFHMDDEIIKNI